MKKLIIICGLLLCGCKKDITSSVHDPQAMNADKFCQEKGENLVSFKYWEYSDSYDIGCGGYYSPARKK